MENTEVFRQNLNIWRVDCGKKEILSLKLQKYERFMFKCSYLKSQIFCNRTKERIGQYINQINEKQVLFTWRYKMEEMDKMPGGITV